MSRRVRSIIFTVAAWVCLRAPESGWACSACFGQSDSRLAVGMNWGIGALLVVVLSVLSGVAAFFVYLARRSARVAEAEITAPAPESHENI